MKRSVLRKYSSVFLATVLIAGIIAVYSPSFMTGVQAQEEYGMDNYKKKVKVEKIKCDNQNFNIDVSNPNIIPEITSDLLKLKKNKNQDYRVLDDQIILLCTNYNDPVKFPVKQLAQNERSSTEQPEQFDRTFAPQLAQNERSSTEQPEQFDRTFAPQLAQNERSSTEQPEQSDKNMAPQPEEVSSCNACLEKLDKGLQEQLITSIASLSNPIIELSDFTLDFTKINDASTLRDISDIIGVAVKDNGPASMVEIIATFDELLPDLDAEGQDQVAEVILCLVRAGILDRDT
jgi:hypothetical protein